MSCLIFVFHTPGEFEKGVDHLTNAIAVCGQPQQLLQVLQQTLPPPVFQMLLTKLPTISQVRMFCRFKVFMSPLETPHLLPVASGTRKGARETLESSKAGSCVTVAPHYITSKTEITNHVQLKKLKLSSEN